MTTVVPTTRGGIQILALVALSLSLLSGHAGAATITFDFEDQEKTSGPSDGALAFLVMSSMGLDVRLSRTSGAPFDIFDTAAFAIFPPGWGDRSLDPFVDVSRVGDRWLMEFAQPIDSFSIQFGDVGPSDDDSPVSLQAFDDRFGLGNLIDSRTGTWPAEMSLPEFGTLSVAGAGIRSVLFGSEFVEATIFPNSLLWDNIVIETGALQAPEPAMGLYALALSALGSRLAQARNGRSFGVRPTTKSVSGARTFAFGNPTPSGWRSRARGSRRPDR